MVRSFATAALALAAAAFVSAENSPPPVPEDAQIGELAFPVTCELLGFLNQTFQTVFTATAPVFGGTGEEIYYTDVVGTITIPSYITGLAPLVAATQASANVTVFLTLTNASPTSLLVYQATIDGIAFSSGEDATIRIPPGNGTLPPLGPVTLGAADTAHRIFLGEVTVDVELQNSTGGDIFAIPVSCGQQDIDFVIGSVDINSTTGLAPFAPSNGYVPTFPPTPQLYESGAFRFPYDCDFGPLGAETVDLTIGGTIPTYFSPGESFSLTNSDSFLRIPESLLTLAKEAYPNVTNFDTTITVFDILFTNASPESFNVASTPIEADISVTDSSDFYIPVPVSGYLTIGPITAGDAGTIVSVAVGSANATAVLKDANGDSLLTLPISCNPPAPLELIGVPVTNAKPTSYSLGSVVTSTAAASSSATSSAGLTLPTFSF